MKIYISMLRGINVGGKNKIKMENLKVLYEGLGFLDVRTYIQSGNVIFNGNNEDFRILGKIIKEKIFEKYGYDIPIVIRSLEGFKDIVKNNPFLLPGNSDISGLHVTFLEEEPGKDPVSGIMEADYSPDEFSISEKTIYLHCPNGYGKTKLTNTFFEKKLNISATTRNWKTITKLAAIAEEMSGGNIS